VEQAESKRTIAQNLRGITKNNNRGFKESKEKREERVADERAE